MRMLAKLGLVCVLMCAFAELLILYSFGLLDYRDRAQASVTELSIRPVHVFGEPDSRVIRLSAKYVYEGANYVATIEEGLYRSNYKFLEDSALYATLADAMKTGSKIDLAIYPMKPATPMLLPDLHLVRLYGYLASIFVGIFIFASKREEINLDRS